MEIQKMSNAIIKLSKSKIKRAQFPILEFVDCRGVTYVAHFTKKVKKWRTGTGGLQKREVITNLIYKRKNEN